MLKVTLNVFSRIKTTKKKLPRNKKAFFPDDFLVSLPLNHFRGRQKYERADIADGRRGKYRKCYVARERIKEGERE